MEHIKGILNNNNKKKTPEEPQVLEDGKHCRLRGRRSRGGWRSSGCETAVVRCTQTTPARSSRPLAAQKCQEIHHAGSVSVGNGKESSVKLPPAPSPPAPHSPTQPLQSCEMDLDTTPHLEHSGRPQNSHQERVRRDAKPLVQRVSYASNSRPASRPSFSCFKGRALHLDGIKGLAPRTQWWTAAPHARHFARQREMCLCAAKPSEWAERILQKGRRESGREGRKDVEDGRGVGCGREGGR